MGEHLASFLKSVADLKEKLMIFTLNVPKPLIFLLLIIGLLLLIVAFAVEVFTFGFVRMGWLYILGILMIGYSLIVALLPSGVLRKEQVVDSWSILIEKGKGRGEEVFSDAKSFLEESKAPNIKMERKKMAPGLIRGILGVEREFLIVKEKGGRLGPYQIFIGARDYGENLDVSWYLTYRPSLIDAIISLLTLGIIRRGLRELDLFDLQDLTAFATNCHHSLLKAVEKQMLSLNQDPSKIERKSRGFLGVS